MKYINFMNRLNGTVNGRRMWKQEGRSNYIYYWDWGVNSGQEWMVGHNPYSAVRGIRSTNQESDRAGSVCVTDVANPSQWFVLTEEEEWVQDETFSMQCN
jgi:hypothetical protein